VGPSTSWIALGRPVRARRIGFVCTKRALGPPSARGPVPAGSPNWLRFARIPTAGARRRANRLCFAKPLFGGRFLIALFLVGCAVHTTSSAGDGVLVCTAHPASRCRSRGNWLCFAQRLLDSRLGGTRPPLARQIRFVLHGGFWAVGGRTPEVGFVSHESLPPRHGSRREQKQRLCLAQRRRDRQGLRYWCLQPSVSGLTSWRSWRLGESRFWLRPEATPDPRARFPINFSIVTSTR
jgi:hypothetical protein